MSYHGLPYIISNLTMWTIGMLKDFRIGSCMRVGDMVYKFTLGMKHPVGDWHMSKKGVGRGVIKFSLRSHLASFVNSILSDN